MIKDILSDTKTRMQKTVTDLIREMASIRTGRASVHLLDHITVDYYGTPTPIGQLATLHAPEPNMLTVQPWDISQINSIEKAIMASNLGITPSNDGRLIRIPIPPLTQERRQSLAKQIGKLAEDHRTGIRQIRRDANDRLKRMVKDKEISEDEEHRALDEVQKLTDEYIKQLDETAKQKEAEILEV